MTGQHPSLEPRDFGLGDYAMARLHCAGEEHPYAHAGRVASTLRPLLIEPSDLLIVQGDTSSAFGAALAAFAVGVPVAHVEAGLRTHDFARPWPEEEFRTAIDARADLLFAPTDLSARNLRDEQVAGEIHVTGNTGIDALLRVEAGLPGFVPNIDPYLLVTCHRRESWGDGLESIAAALVQIAETVAIDFILHPNAYVAGRMQSLLNRDRIRLLDPCSHSELIHRRRDAQLILSDSGGIQEEAPALGVPLLVLREKTERPEGIATGNSRLVGTSSDAIVRETSRLLSDPLAIEAMSRKAFPFGDGQAAIRIAAIVDQWLAVRAEQRRGNV